MLFILCHFGSHSLHFFKNAIYPFFWRTDEEIQSEAMRDTVHNSLLLLHPFREPERRGLGEEFSPLLHHLTFWVGRAMLKMEGEGTLLGSRHFSIKHASSSPWLACETAVSCGSAKKPQRWAKTFCPAVCKPCSRISSYDARVNSQVTSCLTLLMIKKCL